MVGYTNMINTHINKMLHITNLFILYFLISFLIVIYIILFSITVKNFFFLIKKIQNYYRIN